MYVIYINIRPLSVMEDGSRKTEDGSRESEDRRGKREEGRRKTEVRSRKLVVIILFGLRTDLFPYFKSCYICSSKGTDDAKEG